MKKLTTEYWFEQGAWRPSRSFFRELSRQASPVVYAMIDDSVLREAAPELLCLSFMRPRSYENGRVRVDIESKTAAFILCSMTVSWQWKDGGVPDAAEEFPPDSADFAVSMGAGERKALNELLPQLYHPLVKAAQSGLPYDYQIYFGGESLTITFAEDIRDLDALEAVADGIGEVVFGKGKRQVRIRLAVPPRSRRAVEELIFAFRNVPGITKILCR